MTIPKSIQNFVNDKQIFYIYQVDSNLYNIVPKIASYIVITDDLYKTKDCDDCDIRFFTITDWFKKVLAGELIAWICACVPKKYIIKEHVKLLLSTDPLILRKQFDTIKITNLNNDTITFDVCLEVVKAAVFTTQILENHKIVDFKCIESYYNRLKAVSDSQLIECTNTIISPYKKLINTYTDGIKKAEIEKRIKTKIKEREQNNNSGK